MKIYFETPTGKSVYKKIKEALDEAVEPYRATIEASADNIPIFVPLIEKRIKESVEHIMNHAYIRIEK